MSETLPTPSRREIETLIREKLIELIRLSSKHGIDIEGLMHDAIEFCDPEGPFCN
jgi:hypothetical protein